MGKMSREVELFVKAAVERGVRGGIAYAKSSSGDRISPGRNASANEILFWDEARQAREEIDKELKRLGYDVSIRNYATETQRGLLTIFRPAEWGATKKK